MNFCAQNILRNQFQKFIFRNTSFFQLSYQKFKNSNGWTKWYQRKLVTFVKLRDHWFSVAKYSSFFPWACSITTIAEERVENTINVYVITHGHIIHFVTSVKSVIIYLYLHVNVYIWNMYVHLNVYI